MASRLFNPVSYQLEINTVRLYGTVVTSTSGTIASSSCKGAVITKVAAEAGRYRVALQDSYQRLLACNVMVSGAADPAYTVAKGVQAIVRNVAVNSTSAPLLDIQLIRTDSAADSDPEDNASIYIELVLSNSSV